MSNFFLNTYHPLCSTKYGLSAARKFNLPPYIDGSCRREPDFESIYPSITAICRGKAFAPRLFPGDKIIYMTIKQNILNDVSKYYYLVAALEVIKRFSDHLSASEWYRKNNIVIPSSCLIPDNLPQLLEKTLGFGSREMNRLLNLPDDKRTKLMLLKINAWDQEYWEKVRIVSTFIVTKIEYININLPRLISEAELIVSRARSIPQ